MFCLKQEGSITMAIQFIALIFSVQLRFEVHGSVISQTFTKYHSSRCLGEVGHTFQARSHIECCTACLKIEIFTCEVVNFVENGTCHLLKNPTRFLSTVPGWDIYMLMPRTTTTSSTSSSAVPTTTPPGCMEDWFAFGNKCFKIITAGGRTWSDDALTACNNLEGTLASLQTEASFDFIVSQIDYVEYSRLWIGLRAYQGTNDEYVWMDGKVLAYNGWHLGEPSSQEELCVQLMYTNGKYGFTDRSCNQAHFQLCEYNLE